MQTLAERFLETVLWLLALLMLVASGGCQQYEGPDDVVIPPLEHCPGLVIKQEPCHGYTEVGFCRFYNETSEAVETLQAHCWRGDIQYFVCVTSCEPYERY